MVVGLVTVWQHPTVGVERPLFGIFVGGRASRMGGIAKGLLPSPDGSGSLVSRLAAIARSLGAEVVLVGEHAAYDGLGYPVVPDATRDCGPLGGLVALLARAGDRPVIALSCDLPHLDRSLVARLLRTFPSASIVAPRGPRGWEPLAARYDPRSVLPLAHSHLTGGRLGLQDLLDAAHAVALPAEEGDAHALVDWDTPADRAREGPA